MRSPVVALRRENTGVVSEVVPEGGAVVVVGGAVVVVGGAVVVVVGGAVVVVGGAVVVVGGAVVVGGGGGVVVVVDPPPPLPLLAGQLYAPRCTLPDTFIAARTFVGREAPVASPGLPAARR